MVSPRSTNRTISAGFTSLSISQTLGPISDIINGWLLRPDLIPAYSACLSLLLPFRQLCLQRRAHQCPPMPMACRTTSPHRWCRTRTSPREPFSKTSTPALMALRAPESGLLAQSRTPALFQTSSHTAAPLLNPLIQPLEEVAPSTRLAVAALPL